MRYAFICAVVRDNIRLQMQKRNAANGNANRKFVIGSNAVHEQIVYSQLPDPIKREQCKYGKTPGLFRILRNDVR